MRSVWLFIALVTPLTGRAQSVITNARPALESPQLPIVGVRVGYVSGTLHPTTEVGNLTAKPGGEVAVIMSSNLQRRGGAQLEAGLTYLRFADADNTPGGARYAWLTAQPKAIGRLRVMPRVHLLGGVGFNMCLSCWRRPFAPYQNAYAADIASDQTSAPSRFFWLAGVRGTVARNWFVEGRYARTASRQNSGYSYGKTYLMGHTTWWTASVGYWLNSRPATPQP